MANFLWVQWRYKQQQQQQHWRVSGCRRVVVASPSPDAPLYCVGVNDAKMDLNDEPVTSHVSAPTAALTPVLSILQKEFGVR